MIWLLRKDDLPQVDMHGKAALNFNISITIYGVIGIAISLALMLVLIGFLLIFVVFAADLCVVDSRDRRGGGQGG